MKKKYYFICWEAFETDYSGKDTWDHKRFQTISYGETIDIATEYIENKILELKQWNFISILYTTILEVTREEYEKMYPDYK